MRTVIISTLFFCLSLCLTLLPIFGSHEDAVPNKSLATGITAYLIIVIPCVALANALFILTFYYVPLRRLFYATERCLQRYERAFQGEKRGFQVISNRCPPQSAMVDTEGTRDRGDLDCMDWFVPLAQFNDMKEICDSGYSLIQKADVLLQERQHKLNEIVQQQQQQQQVSPITINATSMRDQHSPDATSFVGATSPPKGRY